jgi:hypothetical protein
MEASLVKARPIAADDPRFGGFAYALEVSVERLHLHESVVWDGNPNRVDPDRWRPLIMSFARFYGLRDGTVHDSRLAHIPERLYPRVGAGYTSGS